MDEESAEGCLTRARESLLEVPNGRCRMHGGMSTRPSTREGLERSAKPTGSTGPIWLKKARRVQVRFTMQALQRLLQRTSV